ncbi:MAG: glutaredoxin 3 [Polyangiaceae bacterium]|jgi:glutaredoxin 3|nr:glutaredoxin 3 [Polyangiaceae bacterium]
MPAHVEIYTTPYCPFCIRARGLLDAKGVRYAHHDVSANSEKRAWLRDVTGRRTIPQIFINGRGIGGWDDLYALEHAGQLDELLAQEPPAEGSRHKAV